MRIYDAVVWHLYDLDSWWAALYPQLKIYCFPPTLFGGVVVKVVKYMLDERRKWFFPFIFHVFFQTSYNCAPYQVIPHWPDFTLLK